MMSFFLEISTFTLCECYRVVSRWGMFILRRLTTNCWCGKFPFSSFIKSYHIMREYTRSCSCDFQWIWCDRASFLNVEGMKNPQISNENEDDTKMMILHLLNSHIMLVARKVEDEIIEIVTQNLPNTSKFAWQSQYICRVSCLSIVIDSVGNHDKIGWIQQKVCQVSREIDEMEFIIILWHSNRKVSSQLCVWLRETI